MPEKHVDELYGIRGGVAIVQLPNLQHPIEPHSKWPLLFNKRVEDWRVGEVILKDDRIIIPFKKEKSYEIKCEIAGIVMRDQLMASRQRWDLSI